MRVLPADVYDTLEFMALEYKGIAAGPFFKWSRYGVPDADCPVCAHGLLLAADGTATVVDRRMSTQNKPSSQLVDAGVWGYTSDTAVRAINKRRHRPSDARVPFQEWCAELGVVRGE